MLKIEPKFRPALDPDFLPAVLWNQSYRQLASSEEGSRVVRIAIERSSDERWVYDTALLPDKEAYRSLNLLYLERLVKFLLWAWGGSRIRMSGAPEVVHTLKGIYSPGGPRAFDHDFMAKSCFREPFTIDKAEHDSLTERLLPGKGQARNLTGCRLGFDLGGSDRKCAALIDGEVVFSEEIKWDPYFESDPHYHLAGIQDSLQRAAKHLPRVDAIGGSAAGIYIDNEPRIGSLFRGVSREDFDRHIRGIFKNLKSQWNNVPFEVANDGDVTAIAGAISIQDNAVLGMAMGTSLAAGYIDPDGQVTGWLNELAFAPVDYRPDAPTDEWSGDLGCGVQYFSQQAVGRLLPLSGIEAKAGLPLPEKLELAQSRHQEGDERARSIFQTIGTCLGYSVAHYSEFYDFRHLLFLGRVSSGEGGSVILEEARRVLSLEFPDLVKKITFHTPDEKSKRHGQAVAAASLPSIV